MTNNTQKEITESTETVYTEEQLDVLLQQAGDAVVRMSMMRLVESLTPEQVTAFNHYFEQDLPIQAKLLHVFENYPQFDEIFNDEIHIQQKRVESIID